MKKWLVLLGLTACVPRSHRTIDDARREPEKPVTRSAEEPEKRTLPFHCGDDIDVVDRQFSIEANLASKASGRPGYFGQVLDETRGQKWSARVTRPGTLDLRVTEQTASKDSTSDVPEPSLEPWPLRSRKELAESFGQFIGENYDDTSPVTVRLTPSKSKTPYENAKVMDVLATGTFYGAGMGHGFSVDFRSTGTMTFTSTGILLDARIETTDSMLEWNNFECSQLGNACPKQHTRSSVTKRTYHVACQP